MDKAYHYILMELTKTAIITNAFLIVLFELGTITNNAEIFTMKNFSTLEIIRISLDMLPSIMKYTIPTGTLFASLMTFIRLSSDSEIIAFRSIGMSNNYFVRVVLLFSSVSAFIHLLINVYIIPMTIQDATNVIEKTANNIQLENIQPKKTFTDLEDAYIYANDKVGNESFSQVVIMLTENNKGIITAQNGTFGMQEGVFKMKLTNGEVALFPENTDNFVKMIFDKLTFKQYIKTDMENVFQYQLSYYKTENLIKDIKNGKDSKGALVYELINRVSTAVSTIILGIIGFIFGTYINRTSKAENYMYAILVVILFNSLDIISRNITSSPITAVSAVLPVVVLTALAKYKYKNLQQ